MKEIKEKLNRELIIEQLYQFEFYRELNEAFSFDLLEGQVLDVLLDVVKYMKDIDDLIENHLEKYSISRLSLVDKAIIRLATYELKYTTMPVPIVINEAVNLSKKFSDLDDGMQHKFNHRVIDNIRKTVKSS